MSATFTCQFAPALPKHQPVTFPLSPLFTWTTLHERQSRVQNCLQIHLVSASFFLTSSAPSSDYIFFGLPSETSSRILAFKRSAYSPSIMGDEITAPMKPHFESTSERCVICYPPDDLKAFFNIEPDRRGSEHSRNFVVCPAHSDDEVGKKMQELEDMASQTLGYPIRGKLFRGIIPKLHSHALDSNEVLQGLHQNSLGSLMPRDNLHQRTRIRRTGECHIAKQTTSFELCE